ncbi:MAG: DUF2911 domain-containing protein [Bacteroidetes bacterium]|nr:DUF2911 domain-containing protein [Bacteroidota bacterium]
MKKLILLIFVLMLAITTNAQIKTPQASTSQSISQTVGLTDITLEYSRPSIKGRVIFGGLVPYDKVWRTGANANTKITFSDMVTIGGKELKAGTYAIYTKPSAQSWEIYFYNDASNWGTPQEWDDAKVVATVKAQIYPMPVNIETFTMSFDDITNDSANLSFMWEKVYINIPISFNTDASVSASIESVMGGPGAGDYYTAAVYYLNTNKDISKAKSWIDKAIEMRKEPAFWYYRQQSLIYAKSDDKKGAIKAAQTSLELATEAGNDDYVAMNTKSLQEWGAK